MKDLKHIQLFEAFESKILSKTLGYIESSDISTFMDRLKRLCSSIGFPLSKMSDEYFEYLPFKSAINRAAMTGDEPCEATSKSEFPEYAVAGEKCTNGKIKRQWGTRTRDVVCPVCNGSGVKPKRSELKLLKFWFTKEGKYVNTTLVDGVTRLNRYKDGNSGGLPYSTKISDYTVGPSIPYTQLRGSEIVNMTVQGQEYIAYIFKSSGGTYAIQNSKSGSTPNGREWQRFGRNSWALERGQYDEIRVLTPKSTKSEPEEEINPYTWNTGVNFSYGGASANTSVDVQALIKDAHFAIIFDFGKLKKSDYEKVSDTKDSREERKLGSKLDPNQSDESIKKKNIERYVNILSQRLDISTDIANCNKLVAKSLGYKSALYVVYGSNIYSSLGSIIDYYIKFMSAETDSNKKTYADYLSDKTDYLFKDGMKKAERSNDTIKEITLRLKGNSNEEKYLKVLDLTQNLSDAIYNNIKNYQIDSIDDLEVVAQKISSIRNIIKSDRYGLSRFFNYYIDYVCSNRPDRSYGYLTDTYYTDVDEVIEKMPRVINIISKI